MDNKLKTKTFSAIFSVCFIVLIIIISIYIVCFIDNNMLNKLLIKYNTANELPFTITQSDLNKICNELMNYLVGKTNFLETKIEINGILSDFYSIRTKIHMADVRNIFKTIIYISYFLIVICIYSLFRLSKNETESIKNLYKTFKSSLIIFSIIFAIIITFAIIDFDNFFIKFHQLLFTNDYWLLDPSVDYIICLLPEKIFIIIGIRIAITIVILAYLSYFCLQLLSKIRPHQVAK